MGISNKAPAISCAIRYIVTALITFFVYLSISVIFVGLFYQSTGYTVYKIVDEKPVELYRYSYSEGEDLKYAEYEKEGLELQKVETPSELSGTPKLITNLLTQIIGLVILFAFIHNAVWKLGDSDRNLVSSGSRASDKLRGLKIGLLANIPIYFSYLIFVFAKIGVLSGNWYALFRFINFPIFTLINLLYGQSTSTAEIIPWLNVGLGVTAFIILPLFAHISYTLGFKRISIGEAIIYKKN